jgi:hypothetical protein
MKLFFYQFSMWIILLFSLFWSSFPQGEVGNVEMKKKNFAAQTTGAELVDYSPKSGKGFKYLLSDDRDKYALFNCNEKTWVVIALSEEIIIESFLIGSHERYSSIVKDFQILVSSSYPTVDWIDLGNYTAVADLGDQLFLIKNRRNVHVRFFKFIMHSYNFHENICTMSQIKVFGKNIYESLKYIAEEDEVMRKNTLEGEGEADNQTVFAPLDLDLVNLQPIEPIPSLEAVSTNVLAPEFVQEISLSDSSEVSSPSVIPEVQEETTPQIIDSGPQNPLDLDSINEFTPSTGAEHNHNDPIAVSPQVLEDPFSETQWHLIQSSLYRENFPELFYQKALRKIQRIFFHPTNPQGEELTQNSLDSFLSRFRSKESAKCDEQPEYPSCSSLKPDESEIPPTVEETISFSTMKKEKTEVPPPPVEDTQKSNGEVDEQPVLESLPHPVIHTHPLKTEEVGTGNKDFPPTVIEHPVQTVQEKEKLPTSVTTAQNQQHSVVASSSSSSSSEVKPVEGDKKTVKKEELPVVDIITTSSSITNSVSSENGSLAKKTTTQVYPSFSQVPPPNITTEDSASIAIVEGVVDAHKSFNDIVVVPSSANLTATASVSVPATLSSLIPSGSHASTGVDCLTVLKFAEFRKKRLKEIEKDPTGGSSSVNGEADKGNIFNKLFYRIRTIEANEEVIGTFFDEVKRKKNEKISVK